MSLTILFQFPVDTGTAKISPKVEKANLKDFYLLTGKLTPVGLKLRRSVRGSEFYYAFLKLTRNNLEFLCPSNSFKLSSDGQIKIWNYCSVIIRNCIYIINSGVISIVKIILVF